MDGKKISVTLLLLGLVSMTLLPTGVAASQDSLTSDATEDADQIVCIGPTQPVCDTYYAICEPRDLCIVR